MEAGELDVLGPVDYLVVEFPNLSGEMAAELASSWPTAVSRRRPYWPRSKRTPNPNCKEPDMPLARGRRGRWGVIGGPVPRSSGLRPWSSTATTAAPIGATTAATGARIAATIADLGSSGDPFGERR